MVKRENLFVLFFKSLYRATMSGLVDHDGVEHAGYLAYLGLLSIFPFMVFFVAITGWAGELEVVTQLVAQIQQLLPDRAASALEPRIAEITAGPPQGLLTISLIGIIWTASSTVEGARTVLNRAYRVSTPPAYVWRRLLSILQFLVLTLAVIVAMILLVFAPVAWSALEHWLGLDGQLSPYWTYIRYGLSALLVMLAVAASYYYIPNIKQTIRAVLPGTLVVMLLWFTAAELFVGYLNNFQLINLVYGSLGSIIATLLFFYIMALIYIIGAEFNYFFERGLGRRFEKKEE